MKSRSSCERDSQMVVKSLMSENITVTWRRSTCGLRERSSPRTMPRTTVSGR